MLNNALIWTLFAVCFYAYLSAIADVSEALACPSSGVLNGPTVTAPNVSCTQLELGPINRTALIDWNNGYYSVFNFVYLLSENLLGIVLSLDAGPVNDGTIFVGKQVALIGDNNPTQLLGCETNGTSQFVGPVTLVIYGGLLGLPIFICDGNTTLTFDPPLTNTLSTNNVTLQINLLSCLNLIGNNNC